MRPTIIRKTLAQLRTRPNAPIDWDTAKRRLEGLPGGGLNIAHEAVDRHARGPLAQKTALRWLGTSGIRQEITYSDLSQLSSRFANVFRARGVAKGDTVFVLCGRVPELYASRLARSPLKYQPSAKHLR